MEHHRGHRRLPPARIRDAEHRHLEHRLVLDGDLLDVPRIDVHPARDDHVLLPVHEVEIALLVHIAEIARVEPPVHDGPGGQIGALVVPLHHERAAAADLADLAPGYVAPRLVHDAHLVEADRHAHGSRLAHRVRPVQDRHEPLGEPVELVEAAGEGGVEPMLVLEMERRADRLDHLDGAKPRRIELRMIQERDDLRRHQDQVGDPGALDLREHAAGVEGRMQEIGPAEEHPGHEVQEGAVEDHGPRVEEDALRRHPEHRGEQRAVTGANVVRVHDALGLAGGAAGIDDVVRIGAGEAGVRGLRLRRGADQLVKAAIPRPRPFDEHPAVGPDARHLGPRAIERGRERRRGDDQFRVRVPEQGHEPGLLEERAERHRDEAALGDGAVDLDLLEAIRQHRGDLVPLGETGGQQCIRQPVHPAVQGLEGEPVVLEDQGEVLRPVSRVAGKEGAEMHGLRFDHSPGGACTARDGSPMIRR